MDSNHRLLQIESNSFILSFIRFCKREHHNYDDVEKKCHIVEKKHHIIMMNIPLSVFTYTFTFPFQKLKTFTLIPVAISFWANIISYSYYFMEAKSHFSAKNFQF